MPRRTWQLLIHDIIEAIECVLIYTADMTFEQFVSDRKTVDAVVRNFIIIGEAASHLPEDLTKSRIDIPWREMRDLRNIVVHEYFGVDNLIVWETIRKDLPPVLPLLNDLLNSSDS